ncbi:MAG TPA: hypothetical protein ENG14_04325 [Thermodesulforhabdus norvegica]|uniref:Uncharacterized protein n=1 Tax=Thermodesulforhabdus norvegica TaxID=39841 RepID=A0A7C0WV31_9BACT|nr:hypothetical protein [Thermodesulforhabdus norvegica]
MKETAYFNSGIRSGKTKKMVAEIVLSLPKHVIAEIVSEMPSKNKGEEYDKWIDASITRLEWFVPSGEDMSETAKSMHIYYLTEVCILISKHAFRKIMYGDVQRAVKGFKGLAERIGEA